MKTIQLSETQIRKIIKRLQNKGFTHVKIELEANFDYSSSLCYECDGNGEIYDDEDDEYHTCYDCDGTGRGGEGDLESIGDELEEELRALTTPTYFRAYNDGSVNFEVTTTIPVKDIRVLPKLIAHFKNHPSYVNAENAGMHISILTSGGYDCAPYLDERLAENFKNEVSKLLPALFFLSAADYKTRPQRYRSFQIKRGKSGYPMINQMTNGYEFRTFDTCYSKPDMVLNFLDTISRVMRYYSNETIKRELYPETTFYNGVYSDKPVAQYFDTEKRIKALRASLGVLFSSQQADSLIAYYRLKPITEVQAYKVATKQIREVHHPSKSKLVQERVNETKRTLENVFYGQADSTRLISKALIADKLTSEQLHAIYKVVSEEVDRRANREETERKEKINQIINNATRDGYQLSSDLVAMKG